MDLRKILMILHIKKKLFGSKLKVIVFCTSVAFIVIPYLYFSFRFDYAGGSHRIIPTAVDRTLVGHYLVYYKTTVLTKDQDEGTYYILRRDKAIADQIQNAMVRGQEIVVFYDRWIGFKGVTSPHTSPIIRVEVVQ